MDEQRKKIEAMDNEITVDSKLDLMKFTAKIHSKISDSISNDFVLAKLNDQLKTGIIELTSDAYYVQHIQTLIMKKALQKKKWGWDDKEKEWIKVDYTDKEIELFKENIKQSFDIFMVKLYMTAILNRNVPTNHLLKLLAGITEEEDTMDDALKNTITNSLKENLKNEEKRKQTNGN